MRVLIDKTNFGEVHFVDEPPESTDGKLRLVVSNSQSFDGIYTPDGVIGKSKAADLIVGWASRRMRTADDKDLAKRFLAQWPQGPQL